MASVKDVKVKVVLTCEHGEVAPHRISRTVTESGGVMCRTAEVLTGRVWTSYADWCKSHDLQVAPCDCDHRPHCHDGLSDCDVAVVHVAEVT